MSASGRPWTAAVALFAGLAVLLAGAASYLPFVADDALISLRYAERLVDGKGLTWTDGRAVEGYSNLLWVLLCAAVAAPGFDLVATSRFLGIASVTAILATFAFHYQGPLTRLSPFALCALGLCAMSGTLAVWSIGGLETPLFAALLAIAVSALLRAIDEPALRPPDLWTSSIAFGLLCITRPDGPLFLAIGYATFTFARIVSGLTLPLRDFVRLVSVPAVLTFAQLVFRRLYYGEWVPNTALVKIALSTERIQAGWIHVSSGYWALRPLVFVIAACLLFELWHAAKRRRAVLLASLLFSWTGYLVFVGGDIFPAFRHFGPVVVLSAFVIAETDAEAAPLLRRRSSIAFGLVACAGALLWFGSSQWTEPENRRARIERWEWDGKVVATFLRAAFSSEQPLVAVTAAGCIPFWSGLPSLDMLGLNDYYLPRHPPPGFGKGPLGHELGSADYVLRRNPDLIVFHVGSTRPTFRAGRELTKRPEFFDRYVEVKMVGHDPHRHEASVWVNRTSKKVGVSRRDSRIRVPGYLFARGRGAVAELDESGQIVLRLRGRGHASFDLSGIDARAWKVAPVDATSEAVNARLLPSSEGVRILLKSNDPTPVEVPRVDLVKVES